MIFNCCELRFSNDIFLIYIVDRLLKFNYFNAYSKNNSNSKAIKRICVLNNLFVLFLNNLNVFFLFKNNFTSIINSFFNFITKIILNKKNYSNVSLESSNSFCKFYYINLYRKLVIKFSRYDIKVILFNNYGFLDSAISDDNFLVVNKKKDKLTMMEDYLNNFTGKIKNIRDCNIYTGKGIKYLNEVINIKFYKKVK